MQHCFLNSVEEFLAFVSRKWFFHRWWKHLWSTYLAVSLLPFFFPLFLLIPSYSVFWYLVVLLQLQHDYILGNYPVGRDDAAQLSALQILVEIGFVDRPESCVWVFCYFVLLHRIHPLFFFSCHLLFKGVLLAFIFLLIGNIGEFLFVLF